MSGNSSQTQSSSAPWQPQQSYLLGAFGDAQNLYNQDTASGAYTGDYVAPGTTNQYAADNQAYNYGSTTGYDTANALTNAAGSLTSTGTNNATTATNALNAYGTTNQTGNIVNNANQIASGFNVPGAVQNAMLSANQEAANVTLPNLYAGAAATGNINSDRTAVSQGVVQQGLAEQAANLSAQMQNSAYSTGLSTATTDAQNQNSALANAGYLSNGMTSQGLSGYTSGLNDANTAATMAQTGANGAQTLNQDADTNSLDQFNGTNNYDWTQLQNLFNIVGSKQGSTGTSSTTTTPSTLSTIGSGLGILGSLI